MTTIEQVSSTSIPPRRRWYQFSLRTLLVWMLLVSVLCALVGLRVKLVREERATFAEMMRQLQSASLVHSTR